MDDDYIKIDFLAIGDIVVDEFIKLKDAEELLSHGTRELCVRFGDKVPYESDTLVPAVGNSPNAAVSAARLGLRSALMTNMGDDLNGKHCLSVLEEEKIDTTFTKIEEGKKTNHHFVLWYNVDRTILIKHEKYAREWTKTKESEKYHSPAWIYLSSLGEDSLPFHSEIIDYLGRHQNVKLAFQPGTFQIKFGADKLKEVYKRTDIFFSNVEEAQEILGQAEGSTPDRDKQVLELSKGIMALGPKMVVLSDGPKGAYFYFNNELWKMPLYPDIAPPLDRTGAGDAFSSTFTAALALGLPPLTAFTWGPINSMSVVQEVGAQKGLLSREKLEEYLKKAPENYKPIKVF